MPSRPAQHRPAGSPTAPRRTPDNRPSAARRGYGSAWRVLRAAFLREHPLCAGCERAGRLTPATVVDHVTPHRGDADLFGDHSNLQSLCARCHNAKTAKGQ